MVLAVVVFSMFRYDTLLACVSRTLSHYLFAIELCSSVMLGLVVRDPEDFVML